MKVLAISCLLAASLFGQATGGDIATLDIPAAIYGASSNGISTFSFASAGTNFGTVTIPVIASTPAHPIIAQNIFRIFDGRIEQIGQSWVKHMWAAGGAGCNDPNSWLNPGCTDIYGAASNQGQSTLGPKSEVNPVTAAFPYPFTSPPINSSIDRRLQVHQADFDSSLVPGARYFSEVQYLDPMDAADNNALNNASWREISLSGTSSVSFSPGSLTQVGEPAIQAWKVVDSSVEIKWIDVPGDGRFLIAYKATNLGGAWHYEVAVQNLNSHRSARSVSISTAAGASISNFRFHDVDYHGAEGESGSGGTYSGTDWSSSMTGNYAEWSTDDWSTDVNANALRWGTLYNFSFDSDTPPPASGTTVSLGLYRPGLPSDVSVNFGPENQFWAAGGNGQTSSPGQPFNQPLAVEYLAPGGAPISGVLVGFTVDSGNATLSSPFAITDATGQASVTVTAGNAFGPVSVSAFVSDGTTQFDLFVQGLRVFWMPNSGVLVVNFTYGTAGVPIIVAIDDPMPAPGFVTTPYGDIHTSAVSPGPGFFALDGIGLYGPANPAMITSPWGWTGVYRGLGSLANSGIQKTFQVYGLDAALSSPIIISNPETLVF